MYMAIYFIIYTNMINELKNKIFPFISETQDNYMIHGPSHISRCLIYAGVLSSYENLTDEEFESIQYAIAFHDSGRISDFGVDYDDQASADRMILYFSKENREYMIDRVFPLMFKNNTNTISQKLVYDTDVIDIMRPTCGRGEIENFDVNYSKLLKHNKNADDIINNAWRLIELTDNQKYNEFDAYEKISELMIKNNFFDLK